ncbi:hypothetical protein GW17_00000120 [Ensete ventricosum]|nr:hypothetical protein GW17_00000120 [Ensete ventricosum]
MAPPPRVKTGPASAARPMEAKEQGVGGGDAGRRQFGGGEGGGKAEDVDLRRRGRHQWKNKPWIEETTVVHERELTLIRGRRSGARSKEIRGRRKGFIEEQGHMEDSGRSSETGTDGRQHMNTCASNLWTADGERE